MTKRVHITNAHITQFGKLAGRDFDFKEHQFVVLLGLNESGKSTLSEALAWIFAGRRSDTDFGRRFIASGPAQESIVGGTITGSIDAKSFSIGRSFKIRRTNRGRSPLDPEPEISINSDASNLTNWEDLIRVQSGDDYALRYRITGPYDPANTVDVKQLLEALSIGTSVQKSPAKVLEAIESKGLSLVTVSRDVQLVGARRQDNSFKSIQKDLSETSETLKEISNSQRKIVELEKSITDAEADRDVLQENLRALKTEKTILKAYESTLPLQSEINGLSSDLESKSEVSPEWIPAIEQQITFQIAAENLKRAEGELQTSEQKLQRDALRLGLTDQELVEIDVTASNVTAFNSLAFKREQAFGKQVSERASLLEQETKLGSLEKSLTATADALDIDFEALLQFGSAIPDDVSFGDVVRKWAEKTGDTKELVSSLETLRGDEKSASQKLEEYKARPNTGGAGDTKPVASPTGFFGKYQKQSIVALLVVAAGAMLAGKTIGSVVTVACVIAVSMLLRSGGSGSSGVSSSDEGMRLEVDVRNIRSEIDARIRKIDESKTNEKSLSDGVNATLNGYGFRGESDLARANRIRSELTGIANSVRDYNHATGEKVRIAKVLHDVGVELAEVEAAISQLTTDLHLSRFSSSLDGALMSDFVAVVGLRTTNQTNKGSVAKHRNEIQGILGSFSSSMSGEELLAKFKEAQLIDTEHKRILEEIRQRREKVAYIVSTEPQIQNYLENPISESEIANQLDAIDSKIKEVEPLVKAEQEKIFGFNRDLEDYLERDDLAEVKQRESQLRETQKTAAADGVAWWLAHKIISDIKEEVEKSSQPLLVQRASEIATDITGGAWSGFVLDDDQRIQVRQGGVSIDQDSLSAGSKDVLRLAIRLAVAEMHREKNDIALPIFLDDPTASIDDVRAPRLFEVLKQFSEHHQLIMTTHDVRSSAQAVAVGAVQISMD